MSSTEQNEWGLGLTMFLQGAEHDARVQSQRLLQEGVMNADQVKGRVNEEKGKAKKAAGKATGNRNLEQKGNIQKAAGKVQAGYGDLKDRIKKST